MTPTELLTGLNSAAFTAENELHLREAFGDISHELALEVVRTSWTLTYDVPENYTGARCVQGYLGDKNGPEAEVMFTKDQDAAVQALSRGDSIRIYAWYNHFDKLFSRACFLDAGSDLTPIRDKALSNLLSLNRVHCITILLTFYPSPTQTENSRPTRMLNLIKYFHDLEHQRETLTPHLISSHLEITKENLSEHILSK